VYPFVAISNKGEWPNLARTTTGMLSLINATTLYSAFAMPVWSTAVMSVLCHPLVLLPSLATNFIIYNKYKVLFQGDRARVMNMFLKPNGKEVIVETQDGNSKVIDTLSIYQFKHIKGRFEDRLEFSHGANVYCYISGKYTILDKWVLDQVL
jgi:hypothetical protein